jgi:hypothetical protein
MMDTRFPLSLRNVEGELHEPGIEIIRLRLSQMDPAPEPAAWKLGASEWKAMRFVISVSAAGLKLAVGRTTALRTRICPFDGESRQCSASGGCEARRSSPPSMRRSTTC